MSATTLEPSELSAHAHARCSIAPPFVGSEPRSDTLLLQRRSFSIYVARTPEYRAQSSELMTRMYRARGYRVTGGEQTLVHAEEVTFVARNADTVFGTLTVCVDSPTGMHADAEYRSELSAFRIVGRKLAEVTRLAIDPCRGTKELLGALFCMSYLFSAARNVEDMFIEVHPRHVGFYTRMLRFRIAGDAKVCTRVAAPAVLLHIDLRAAANQIDRYARYDAAKPTLYPYFCSKEESLTIASRLAA